MAEQEDKRAQAAKSIYLTKFAEVLQDRGYGYIVEDEDRLGKAISAVQKLDDQAEKVAAQIQPVLAGLTDEVLNELLDED